jgi:excisionase family DNA binding protein
MARDFMVGDARQRIDVMTNARPEAVGPRKAAELMDVSEDTIRRLIKSGRLKARRIGRQWRILVTDLKRGST